MRRADVEYKRLSAGIKHDIIGKYAYSTSPNTDDPGFPVAFVIKDFKEHGMLYFNNQIFCSELSNLK